MLAYILGASVAGAIGFCTGWVGLNALAWVLDNILWKES